MAPSDIVKPASKMKDGAALPEENQRTGIKIMTTHEGHNIDHGTVP